MSQDTKTDPGLLHPVLKELDRVVVQILNDFRANEHGGADEAMNSINTVLDFMLNTLDGPCTLRNAHPTKAREEEANLRSLEEKMDALRVGDTIEKTGVLVTLTLLADATKALKKLNDRVVDRRADSKLKNE